MARILIVDDEESIRTSLGAFAAKDGHAVTLASDAMEAMERLGADSFDVVVTDIILPRKSGVVLLGEIRDAHPDTQVIVITGEPEVETAAEAVRHGAFDYLAKPISRQSMTKVIDAAVARKELIDANRRLAAENQRHREQLEQLVSERTRQLRDSEDRYRSLFASLADPVFVFDDETRRFVDCNQSVTARYGYSIEDLLQMTPADLHPPQERGHVTADIADGSDYEPKRYTHITKAGEEFPVEIRTAAVEFSGRHMWISVVRDITARKEAEDALRRAMGGTIHAIVATTESRDPYTAGHQRRVTELAVRIGQEMGLVHDRVDSLQVAGLMHDIGKISIPAEILSKPTRLTDIEMELVRGHPQMAYDILKNVEFPWPVAEFVLQHHERIDGSGYPNGLRGNEIRLEARIIAVADVVEAISSHRPYRPARGIGAGLEEIERNTGRLYDPDVVAACVRLFRKKGFRFEANGSDAAG
jgi:PAS domain S-box-containing protein